MWEELLLLSRWTPRKSPQVKPLIDWPEDGWMKLARNTYVENPHCMVDSHIVDNIHSFLQGMVRRVFVQHNVGEEEVRDLDTAILAVRSVGHTLLPGQGEAGLIDILQTRHFGFYKPNVRVKQGGIGHVVWRVVCGVLHGVVWCVVGRWGAGVVGWSRWGVWPAGWLASRLAWWLDG